MILEGYAAVFNQPATIHTLSGPFTEVVKPGAFRETLKRREQFLLYAHRADGVIAGASNGTLKLWEDSVGLRFEADLIDTSLSSDVHKLVSSRTVSKMSFGFAVEDDHWRDNPQGPPTRELLAVNVHEVSVVPMPAYTGTTVTARSKRAKPTANRLAIVNRARMVRAQSIN